MKKLLVTILAVVYITVSSGATINMHYCMGKLMTVDLKQEQKGTCGSCGMEKVGHKGCCKDEQKKLQIEKDQKISESSFQFLSFVSDISVPCYFSYSDHSSLSISYPVSHAPPGVETIPIFIRNCNFRI
ncbi:MAG: hypothetical protein EPO58_05000 [Chitinophagaceae bacterium]|jgi:hypothetical protein|nr:MAG: hypothetical protein EPO58_05000 [Chitinophagaceae bacterium]